MDDRLKLPLAENETERTELGIAIDLRNIYTHNRGVVNELFLNRISGRAHSYEFLEGKRFNAGF